MKTVIIYGSCYGTSERYARELARQTGAELHAAKDLRDLTGCGLAVHIGGSMPEGWQDCGRPCGCCLRTAG